MSEQYTGDPDNYPEDFTIPDDADPPTAAVTNVALEALGDRTAYLRTHSPRTKTIPFTATGQLVVPERVTKIRFRMWGGGGGGGKGATGTTDDNKWVAGAGAGGAAQVVEQVIDVTPGETLDIVIGAGGSGSTVFGTNGSDGGDTLIKRGDTVLARAKGAQGGQAPIGHVAGLWVHFAIGGGPVANALRLKIGTTLQYRVDLSSPPWDTMSLLFPMPPGTGGWGGDGSSGAGVASVGSDHPYGYTGGTAGTHGTDIGDARGGGGGGGGAAGPGGNGGNGGNGGGVTQAGNAGSNASANSGAGGGGGGSAGKTSPALAGGNGGNGGSGFCLAELVRDEEDA